MPANAWTVMQLADDTQREITGSYQQWTAFLTTAARLYKYPYREQLMIFAQRPEATACAEYDLWNRTMRRYVRRGSKGIALVDTSREVPRIRYVFDVADTGARHDSRSPFLWQLEEQHMNAVHDALEQRFGADDFMMADLIGCLRKADPTDEAPYTLVRQIAFNSCVGNHDAHAKNY